MFEPPERSEQQNKRGSRDSRKKGEEPSLQHICVYMQSAVRGPGHTSLQAPVQVLYKHVCIHFRAVEASAVSEGVDGCSRSSGVAVTCLVVSLQIHTPLCCFCVLCDFFCEFILSPLFNPPWEWASTGPWVGCCPGLHSVVVWVPGPVHGPVAVTGCCIAHQYLMNPYEIKICFFTLTEHGLCYLHPVVGLIMSTCRLGFFTAVELIFEKLSSTMFSYRPTYHRFHQQVKYYWKKLFSYIICIMKGYRGSSNPLSAVWRMC